jgi:phosphate transport system protein
VIYLVRGTDVRHLGLKRMKEEVQGRVDSANVLLKADDK